MRINFHIVACLVAYPLTGQMETGNAVRVHVINSVTGSPISGANVTLQQEQDTLRGRTDAGGVFAGRTHFAGNYLLIVTSKGLRMMTGAGMMGKMVEARAGTETDLSVQMLPLGVITGRVLDQYGDPVRHAIVSTHDKQGATVQDQYYPSDRAATTDDRGEYRIAEVEPGKHYLAVEYSSADDERRAAGHSRYRWPQTGGLTLYPDTTDIDQAQQVEVGAGQTTRLNDVNLNIQPALTISGHVKPPPVDRSHSLNLVRSKLTLHTAAIIQAADSEADGSFKIDVLPGKYILTASDSKTGGTSKELLVDVRDKSITGLELELRSGYDIRGRFIIDGQERIDLSKLVLTFGGLPVKIDGNGTFETKVPGGKAMHMLQGLPEDWYLEDVRVAGKKITGRYFEIEPGATDVIMTLCPRGARVEISLEGAVSRLDAVYVVLLPETGGISDFQSIPRAQADDSGKFIVRAVPPGPYRVFTLNASNWALLVRPDVLLEKYRSSAPLISVALGEQKSIIVPVSKIQPQ